MMKTGYTMQKGLNDNYWVNEWNEQQKDREKRHYKYYRPDQKDNKRKRKQSWPILAYLADPG
jgi:hypothetical protein